MLVQMAVRAVQVAPQPTRCVRRFRINDRPIYVVAQATQCIRMLRIATNVVQHSARSINMVMIFAPVIFGLSTYIMKVLAAPINLGGAAVVQGEVVPRAMLRNWLWRNAQEVAVVHGVLHILRSGIVIFVVG